MTEQELKAHIGAYTQILFIEGGSISRLPSYFLMDGEAHECEPLFNLYDGDNWWDGDEDFPHHLPDGVYGLDATDIDYQEQETDDQGRITVWGGSWPVGYELDKIADISARVEFERFAVESAVEHYYPIDEEKHE